VLHETDGIDVEPSATAGLTIPWRMGEAAARSSTGVHLVWLTGGAMVPGDERVAYVDDGLRARRTDQQPRLGDLHRLNGVTRRSVD
jgi:hypothetical protein